MQWYPSSSLNWVENLPASRMIYPPTFGNQLKYLFWRVYTPLHPYLRDVVQFFGITSAAVVSQQDAGRQNYHLGKVAPGQSIEQFVSFLIAKGFANHLIAWRDEGEVVSLRYMTDFAHQYHLRVFEDGEVRGHYEYTTECHPWLHFKAIGQESRRADFLGFLGDRIV